MYKFQQKQWNWRVFGESESNVKKTGAALLLAQKEAKGNWDNHIMQEEMLSKPFKIERTLKQRESFWRMKSCGQWLMSGEDTTAFFHTVTKIKVSQNKFCRSRTRKMA